MSTRVKSLEIYNFNLRYCHVYPQNLFVDKYLIFQFIFFSDFTNPSCFSRTSYPCVFLKMMKILSVELPMWQDGEGKEDIEKKKLEFSINIISCYIFRLYEGNENNDEDRDFKSIKTIPRNNSKSIQNFTPHQLIIKLIISMIDVN